MQLIDSQGESLGGGQLVAGKTIASSFSGLIPYAQYDVYLFGPVSTRTSTAPDGRAVTAFLRLTADGSGNIPYTILDYNLLEGGYLAEIVFVSSRGRATPILQATFTVATAGTTDRQITCKNGMGEATVTFAPDEDVSIEGQGFPASQTLDLYVVRDQMIWSTGDPLNDASGYASFSTRKRSGAASRDLSGSADSVTTDAGGAFPATVVWAGISQVPLGTGFDVVVDVNRNGLYDEGTDFVSDHAAVGFVVQNSARLITPLLANVSVDENTVTKDYFNTTENIYAYLNPEQRMELDGDRWVKKYLVAHRDTWEAGTPLVDVSGYNGSSAWEADTVESGCTNEGRVLIWAAPLRPGQYDIVIDVNRNDQYDPGVDILDGSDGSGGTTGVTVVAPPDAKKWTVLVFLNADNNLDAAGIADINEMEQVGSSNNVNIVVQIDRSNNSDYNPSGWTETRRYYITQDSDTSAIGSTLLDDMGEENMGEPETLRDFINWGKTTYPAERYMVVVWNHGGGFRSRSRTALFRDVSVDETSGSSLSVPEVTTAIAQAGGAEVVGFDACLMAMVETATQFDRWAEYLVASEEFIPGEGWAYHRFLNGLVANPNMTPAQLSAAVVTSYGQYTSGTTLSAIDISRIIDVQQACNALAEVLITDPDGAGTGEPPVNEFRTELQNCLNQTEYFDYSDFRDAYHFAQQVKATISVPAVQSTCDTLMASIDTAVTSEYHSNDIHPNSHGLSIWLPGREDYNNYSRKYQELNFAHNTKWDEFLSELWGLTLRVELTWGSAPSDLDSHLWDAFGNHLYYPYAGEYNSTIPGAWLDRDDVTSYGPENISITFLTPNGSNLYSYAVYLYSGNASSETATVRIFRGGASVPERTFTRDHWDMSDTRWWHVFDINPDTGAIIARDTDLTSPPRGMPRAMPAKKK